MPNTTRALGWRRALAGLTLLTATAAGPDDLEAQFLGELTEAYITFGRAERAREAQAWGEALGLYEDALAHYRRLHNLYPDRQPDIVQYRMADCANQIEALRRRVGKAAAKTPTKGSPAASAVPSNADLAAQLEAVRAELDREKASGREMMEAFKTQLAEALARARQAGPEDQRRLENAEKAASDARVALARLEQEQAALRQQLEQAQKTAQDAEALLKKKEEETADRDLRLRQALRDVETLQARLEEERSVSAARQHELEQATFRSEALRKKLEAAEKRAEPLERERTDFERTRTATKPAGGDDRFLPVFRGAPSQKKAEADPLDEALALEKKEAWAAALARYRTGALRRSSPVDAVKGQGRCLLKLGRVNEAVRVLKPALAQSPTDSEIRLLLGIAFCKLRQYRQATDVLNPAVLAAPNNALQRNALGVAWIGLGNLAAAQKELELAVTSDPRMALAHLNLAMALAMDPAADREAARAHYRRALELGAAPDASLAQALGLR